MGGDAFVVHVVREIVILHDGRGHICDDLHYQDGSAVFDNCVV